MKTIYRILFMAAVALTSVAFPVCVVADDTEIETEIAVEDCKAKPCNGGIELYAASRTSFEIYSITGQRVKSVAVEDSSVRVELPDGCYIVRCSKWSKKVVVK